MTMRRPIDWHGDYFPGDAQRARQSAANGQPANAEEDPWQILSRGQNIGKTVVIQYNPNPNTAPSAISTELVRIDPRGGLAMQLSLTLATPQGFILVNPLDNPLSGQGGYQDPITAAQTPYNAGGDVFGNAGSDNFSWGNCVAIVQWGTGSIENRAEIDFLDGLCLNLSANFLRVTAFVDYAPAVSAYTVAANLGPGSTRPSNAQRTMMVGAVANGAESPLVTIPRFAKTVRPCVCDAEGTGVGFVGAGTVRFWRGVGAAKLACGDFYFSTNNPQPIPIPNGAVYFTIVGGVAGTNIDPQYSAVFELAIS